MRLCTTEGRVYTVEPRTVDGKLVATLPEDGEVLWLQPGDSRKYVRIASIGTEPPRVFQVMSSELAVECKLKRVDWLELEIQRHACTWHRMGPDTLFCWSCRSQLNEPEDK